MRKKEVEGMVYSLNNLAESEKTDSYYPMGVYHAAVAILETLSTERFYLDGIMVEKNGHRTSIYKRGYRLEAEDGMIDVNVYDIDITSMWTDEDGIVQYDLELAVAFDYQEVC